jgi:putative membrane protein
MWREMLIAGVVIVGAAFVGTARAADADASKMDKGDMKFIKEACVGGETEVALGKLAAEKATSADVKAFGQKMADDHGKANDELMKLASSKGVDLSMGKERRQKKIDDKVADLSKKSGADFDKAYVDDMVKDHEKDVKEFKKQAETAKDEDLKKWAGQTLPTLEEHLKMIKDVQAKMKA